MSAEDPSLCERQPSVNISFGLPVLAAKIQLPYRHAHRYRDLLSAIGVAAVLVVVAVVAVSAALLSLLALGFGDDVSHSALPTPLSSTSSNSGSPVSASASGSEEDRRPCSGSFPSAAVNCAAIRARKRESGRATWYFFFAVHKSNIAVRKRKRTLRAHDDAMGGLPVAHKNQIRRFGHLRYAIQGEGTDSEHQRGIPRGQMGGPVM